MTKETTVARALLVLVFAPSGGLFGKAVAAAAAGHEWWPWLVAAAVWLVVSGLVSMAVSNRLDEHR
jgi:CHASE2 domain-containing sensor protein